MGRQTQVLGGGGREGGWGQGGQMSQGLVHSGQAFSGLRPLQCVAPLGPVFRDIPPFSCPSPEQRGTFAQAMWP